MHVPSSYPDAYFDEGRRLLMCKNKVVGTHLFRSSERSEDLSAFESSLCPEYQNKCVQKTWSLTINRRLPSSKYASGYEEGKCKTFVSFIYTTPCLCHENRFTHFDIYVYLIRNIIAIYMFNKSFYGQSGGIWNFKEYNRSNFEK